MDRVVFDIENEPFLDEFRKAVSIQARRSCAPCMRVACLYSEVTGRYKSFSPTKAQDLIERLRHADEVISFNGKNFDLLVLQRHYQLKGRIPRKGKHVDLYEILSKKVGFRVSLNLLAKINLGEGKHTDGRKMANLNIAELRIACRSDVRQTFRLWQLYREKRLKLPQQFEFEPRESFHDYLGGPGNHMPPTCPHCGSKKVEFMEEDDTESMSDGQASEYEAGLYGSGHCNECDKDFDWCI